MKAVVVNQWLKSVADLRVAADAPDPVAGDGDVVVEIHAAGLNFLDILMVQGKYQSKPPFPFIPGVEFAGKIIQVGNKVTGFKVRFVCAFLWQLQSSPTPHARLQKVGDRVFGTGSTGISCYAEKVAVRATVPGSLFKVPDGLSMDEAAAVFMNYPTSWVALHHRGQLQRSELCLIHAAAGGVGSAAIHIAKYLGATVIATAGSREKCLIAQREGADHVIDYTADLDWVATVNRIAAGMGKRGADVIYDPVGMFVRDTSCVAWNGRILVVGFAGTEGRIEAVPANRLLLKGASLVGVFWGGTMTSERELVPKIWEGVFELFAYKKPDGTRYKPLVYRGKKYVGLESIPEALADLASRKTYGKVVIDLSKGSTAGGGGAKL
ncbi:alcohol dehydrogenase [Zopfochytrium polystomum]|nr:alcohol dehydrogenase [Zopfochytrium polystomum]